MKRLRAGYVATTLAVLLFNGSAARAQDSLAGSFHLTGTKGCLLYTSDAADE